MNQREYWKLRQRIGNFIGWALLVSLAAYLLKHFADWIFLITKTY